MAQFEYFVKDTEGHDQTGVEEAPDANSVVQSLRKKGYLIVRISELAEKKFFGGGGKKKSGLRGGSVKIDDLVIFARQLATLIGAGVPLLQSLETLVEQTERTKLRETVRGLKEDVQGGKSLSEAIEKHPLIFSNLFVHMIRAGETSGHLEEILDRAATYMEKTSILQKKIKAALTYPAVVSVMAFGITTAMLIFVIPKFAEIFQSLNATLPTPTRVLIDVSAFVRANFLMIFLLLIGLFILFRQWAATKRGRFIWDSVKLKMPIFGNLFLKVSISKFARTFSTLIKSGVPILSSLEIVAHTSGNSLLEELILGTRIAVSKGEGLSGPLSESPLLPPMVVQMMAVGEETGELEKMLVKIADFYDSQVDSAVSSLTSLIEPMVIAFLGVVVGGIVFAIYLPILNLTQAIH